MATPKEQLMVFNKIENAKINEIFNLADENIIKTRIKKEKIHEIIGDKFDATELYYINNVLFNFVSNEKEKKLFTIIESSQLPDDKKNILKDNLQKIRKRTSKDKINRFEAESQIKELGHPHIHSIGAFTEFRPISNNGKIISIVPAMIIKGIIYNPDTEENLPINFQMSLKQFEKMIENFQKDASGFKEEIAEFREKFGSDIID